MRFSQKGLTKFQKFFSIWVPENTKQDWRVKLESVYSLVVHYCKNTVCDKLTENTSNAPNLSAEFVCPTVWDFDEKKASLHNGGLTTRGGSGIILWTNSNINSVTL